jgi:hypothetical protein
MSFMVSEKRSIGDPHWHTFLALLSSNSDDLDAEKHGEALALCQLAQKRMASLLPDTQRYLVSALATFSGREKALNVLSEGIKPGFSTDSPFVLAAPMAAMAKDALKDLDFDMALKFLRDPRFHGKVCKMPLFNCLPTFLSSYEMFCNLLVRNHRNREATLQIVTILEFENSTILCAYSSLAFERIAFAIV